MFEWSTNSQFFCKQCSLRTLFTSETLQARTSSPDLLMRLDIVIVAEVPELTDSATSINSIAHSQGVLEDRKLLVLTWIIISSGFLRRSGLIWSFMSCVVHPRKVAILTCEFWDILWPCRYLRVESPTIITFFRRLGCKWLCWFVELTEPVFRDLISEDDENVLCPWTSLFNSRLFAFLWICSWSRRGSNLFVLWITLAGIGFWLWMRPQASALFKMHQRR